MAKFTIPTDVVEKEPTNFEHFPEGVWEGTIEVYRQREIFQEEGGDFHLKDRNKAFFAEKCEAASLQIGGITGCLEGQPEVGDSKYFMSDIIMSFDDTNWDEYENEEGADNWKLGQTQLRLTKLAHALGLTDDGPDGVGPIDDFDNMLRLTADVDPDTGIPQASGLNGLPVRFKVYHRKFKKKDGTPDRQALIGQFYPVE